MRGKRRCRSAQPVGARRRFWELPTVAVHAGAERLRILITWDLKRSIWLQCSRVVFHSDSRSYSSATVLTSSCICRKVSEIQTPRQITRILTQNLDKQRFLWQPRTGEYHDGSRCLAMTWYVTQYAHWEVPTGQMRLWLLRVLNLATTWSCL